MLSMGKSGICDRYDRRAVASTDEARLLPDADQRKLLAATLERVNRATNAARATALQRNVVEGHALRDIVKDAVEQAKLPDGFVTPIVQRLELALRRRAGKQAKFSTYQSLTLPASAFKWAPAADRVTMLTATGRRTIPVRVDPSRGDLRPPLAGRPVTLVFRNNEFELHAADVRRSDDGDEEEDDGY
jgi:hypothetical protein